MQNFPFRPGDRVRLPGWTNYLTVTAVGDTHFLAREGGPGLVLGFEGSYTGDRWMPYVEPPKVTEYKVTTERRLPKRGESYVLPFSSEPEIFTASYDHFLAVAGVDRSDVVTKIEKI